MPRHAGCRKRKKGTATPSPLSVQRCAYRRVVHVELDRMRRHAEPRDFLHLQLDVGIDVGVGEDAALGQERAALVEVVERLVEA